MNLKEEFRIMKNFYVMSALAAFTNLTYAIFVIYLIAINFTVTEVGLILAMTSLLIILFEIPTGVIADVFGRKLSTFISLFSNAFAILILFLTTNKLWIFISAIIGAISFTFRSGAEEAWNIDYFLHYGKKKYLNRILSRQKSIFSITGFIALSISSALLILFKNTYGFINVVRVMFLIESILLFIISAIILITKEPYFKKKVVSSYFKNTIKESKIVLKKSIKVIKLNQRLLFLFLGCIVLYFGTTAISSGWQIQFKNNNINESFFSIIMGVCNIISFILLSLNEKITKKVGGVYGAIIFSIFGFAIINMLFSFNLGGLLILVFLVISGLSTIFSLNTSIHLNKLIPSKVRATIISLKSVTDQIPTMIGQIVLFGLVTDLFSINISIFVGGLIALVSLFLFKKAK